jgi:quercetin dioxygenase-like cupin family protein
MQSHPWDSLPKVVVNDKIWRRSVCGQRMTMAQFFFAKGGVVPRHQHENEQLTYVLEGALRFTVGDEEVTVRSGEVLHIPPDLPHGAVALVDSVDIEVFSPVRADWVVGK